MARLESYISICLHTPSLPDSLKYILSFQDIDLNDKDSFFQIMAIPWSHLKIINGHSLITQINQSGFKISQLSHNIFMVYLTHDPK